MLGIQLHGCSRMRSTCFPRSPCLHIAASPCATPRPFPLSCSPRSVALNPQRPNEFVSGSVDSTALIWDMRAGSKPQLSYIGHESDINAVAFMGNGYSFATGSDDYSCLLFDTRSKGQVAKYAAPRSSAASGLSINGGVYGLDFSKSGRVLFAAYEDGKAVAWETISKERMYHKIEHTGTEGESDKKRMSGVGVSPDGKSVCTASWDTTLHVWA